jgi:hypothetical protein
MDVNDTGENAGLNRGFRSQPLNLGSAGWLGLRETNIVLVGYRLDGL